MQFKLFFRIFEPVKVLDGSNRDKGSNLRNELTVDSFSIGLELGLSK